MFPRDPLPDEIGSYKIVRHLSARGGADLYLGRHQGPMGFERECVLKLVASPMASGDEQLAKELAHEAAICSQLSHPAVVRMHDFFEHGDHLVLVFEHFGGVSLARVMSHFRRRRQRVPDNVVWYLGHRLFGALSHAHALTDEHGIHTPVIHRDVQPAHVVISSDAQVRLAGFGIAKIAGTAGDTAVGLVKGTPAYMAPEQARGERVTEKVDVFAAGLVLWELLSGRPVMPGGHIGHGAGLLDIIAGRRVESITSLRRDIPRELAAAIDACLEPLTERRTIDAASVERWLNKVVDVASGRSDLRDRLVQMRNASIRPSPLSLRASMPPRVESDPRHVPSRFPGVATRSTGRLSEAPPGGEARVAPSRRMPPFRASSSSSAPPRPGYAVTSDEEFGTDDEFDCENALPPPPLAMNVDASTASALHLPPGVMAPPKPSMQATNSAKVMLSYASDGSATSDTAIMSRRKPRSPRRGLMVGGLVSLVLALSATAVLLASGVIKIDQASQPAAASQSVALVVVEPTTPPPRETAEPAAPVLPAPAASQPPVAATTVAQPAPPPAATADVAEIHVPRREGRLLVEGPPQGTVYISGVSVGPTDKPLVVPCRAQRFVRVGRDLGAFRGVEWLASGQSVLFECGRVTRVPATPRFPVADSKPAGDKPPPKRPPSGYTPDSPF